jgi:hypothetical protein
VISGTVYLCGLFLVSARIQGGPPPWRTTGIFTVWELLPMSVILVFGLSRRLRWRYVLAATVVGFNVARFLSFRLPVEGPFILLRTWSPIGSAAAGIALLVWVAKVLCSAADASGSPFFVDRLESKLQSGRTGELALRYALVEAALVGYVVAPKRFRFRAPEFPEHAKAEQTFTMWECNGQRSTTNAIICVIAVETVALHVALAIWVNEVAAGIVSALSFYSIVWLLGHARATRAHPLFVDETSVRIRAGLQTKVDVPRELISIARQIRTVDTDTNHDHSTLRAVPFGSGNIELILNEPIPAITFRGRHHYQRVILNCDDPEQFLALLTPNVSMTM